MSAPDDALRATVQRIATANPDAVLRHFPSAGDFVAWTVWDKSVSVQRVVMDCHDGGYHLEAIDGYTDRFDRLPPHVRPATVEEIARWRENYRGPRPVAYE